MPKKRERAGDANAVADPRRTKFSEFYRNGGPDFRAGNAYRSALAAGYSPATAKSNCHLLARDINVAAADALRALGCDAFSQARKLLRLQQAKTVKWNPQKFPGTRGTKKRKGKAPRGGWDAFDDGDLQLDATKEINRLLDAYPAPKEPGDTSRPVQIIFPASFKSLEVRANDGKDD